MNAVKKLMAKATAQHITGNKGSLQKTEYKVHGATAGRSILWMRSAKGIEARRVETRAR